MAVPAGRYQRKTTTMRSSLVTAANCYYLRRGGYDFTRVCLSVCFFPVNGITQKLLTISLRNFTERLDIIQGPIDYILSDLDPRKGHWRSKGLNCFFCE